MRKMQLKSIFKECRRKHKGVEKDMRRQAEWKSVVGRGRSYIAPESPPPSPTALDDQPSKWADLPPELLIEIVRKVEASETSWPARGTVVACAAICKSWREIVKEIIRTPEECGLLTFPMSLKQPGPRDSPIQCFIKRERATSILRLYLGLSPALSGDASKLLLAAKKVRKATHTQFLISLAAANFSRSSSSYMGKLRSNFFGTKFSIYDYQPCCNSSSKFSAWSKSTFPKKISWRTGLHNYNVATVSYELNVLRTRGPRRMQCTMHKIPLSAIQEGGTAPTPATFTNGLHVKSSLSSVPREQKQESSSTSLIEPSDATHRSTSPLVLRNKAPRWHEQLQCWCLNFKGRVTVASVKNFQLVAAVDLPERVPSTEQERVILQFGKIGKDFFTMDYSYPLSAFQAFSICLSSFDTKPACE